MRKAFVIFALVGLLAGAVQAQDTVYKLRVTEWTCRPEGNGVFVARGRVVNQSGRLMTELRANLRVVAPGVAQVNSVPLSQVRGAFSSSLVAKRLAAGASVAFAVRIRAADPGLSVCQLWFRNPSVIQIPTRIPVPR